MTDLFAVVAMLLAQFSRDGLEIAVDQLGEAGSEILTRLRGFVVQRLTGLGADGEVLAQEIERGVVSLAPSQVTRALHQALEGDTAGQEYIADLVRAFQASLGDRQGGQYRAIVVGDDARIVGSVLGTGSVRVAGDIVGGDKS